MEIDYVILKVPLFKCKWIPNNTGVQTDELEFTRVDLGKATYNTEPFIMATQAKQIFYVTDLADLMKRWSIVLNGKRIPHSDDESFDISSTPYATQVPTWYEKVDRDDVHVIRNDHQEDIWKN